MTHGALDYATDGPTAELCRFAVDARYDHIDSRVLERARYLLLDSICCALVGAKLPWSSMALKGISGADFSGSSPVWGCGVAMSKYSAVVLNSTFIEGFELDDYHEKGAVHPSAAIVPVALSDVSHADGKTILTALVVGYELGPRLGMSIGGYGGMLERGWHCGSVVGTIAAAATAGRIQQLTEGEMQNALGIAATQSCGLMAGQYEAMAKRMDIGFAARAGVMAVDLAGAGYTGIQRVLEREYGGLASAFGYPNAPNLEGLLSELGAHWELEQIIVKPYPASGTASLAVDAMLIAREEHGIRAEDVDSIDVLMAEHPYIHVGFELTRPAPVIGAQMNSAYLTAVSLLDGEVTTRQFSPERMNSEDVWSLIERIRVRHDASMDDLAKAGFSRATDFSLNLNDGSSKSIRVLTAPGTQDRILTNTQIEEKYDRSLREVTSEEHAADIKEMVLSIDDLEDTCILQSLLMQEVSSPL